MEFSPDKDLNDEGLDKLEALVIDVLSPPSTVLNNENSKAFFISLGLIEKAEEMAINLANRSFSHSLITIGNILPNHISLANAAYDMSDTNPFTYIATNRYSSDKFYGIMIDTDAFKYSTAGYG